MYIDENIHKKEETRYSEKCSECGKMQKVYKYTNKVTEKVTFLVDECPCQTEKREKEETLLKQEKENRFSYKCNSLFPFLKVHSDILDHTFENFETSSGNEEALEEAKKTCFNYWGNIGLNFCGGYGNGKRRLLLTMANTQYQKNKTVIFAEYTDLTERIMNTYSSDSKESKEDLLDCLCNSYELFIAGVGCGEKSKSREILFLKILNDRQKKGLRTHFSMNPDGEANLSDSTRSKIIEYARPVLITSSDFRLKALENKLAKQKI